MGREHLPKRRTGSRIRQDGAEGSPKQLSLSPRLEKGHEGESKKGALNEARLLHSSYPLGPRWISITYASGPATDLPLELEGLGLSQGL